MPTCTLPKQAGQGVLAKKKREEKKPKKRGDKGGGGWKRETGEAGRVGGRVEEAAQGWGTSVKAPMSSEGGEGYEYQARGVCMHHVPVCMCVCVEERERRRDRAGRQEDSSRVGVGKERERERRGEEGVLGNGRSGRVCHSC